MRGERTEYERAVGGERRRGRWWLWIGLLPLGVVLAGCPSPPDEMKYSNDPAARGASNPGTSPDQPADQTGATSPTGDALSMRSADPPRQTVDRHDGEKAGGAAAPSEGSSAPSKKVADWPAPDVVLAISGRQRGYIEPCGCTGLANQKGGLARRFTLLRSLRQRGWKVVPIDVGNQIRRFGVQAEIKFQFTVQGLRQMGYGAVVLGPSDLRLPATMLAGVTLPADPSQTSLFVCGDASLFGDESFLPPTRLIRLGDDAIGVTSVMSKMPRGEITAGDIIMREPREAVAAARKRLAAAKTRFNVLVAHGPRGFAEEMARRWPELDLVVCVGEPGEPERELRTVAGSRAKLMLVGDKGMFVGLVGIYWKDGVRLRHEPVPLDARFADSPEMLKLMAEYQGVLKQKGLKGLGVDPRPHPSGNRFVGSAACADCHEEAYAVWKDGIDGKWGPHAHATESLVHPGERSEIPRHFDPECLSCHVTGWNPQKFFPYESGYVALEASKALHGNGCENCHGPGSAHVAAENGDIDADDKKLEALRAAMHLELESAETQCMKCHDLDNSPDFHVPGAFRKYWEKIEH